MSLIQMKPLLLFQKIHSISTDTKPFLLLTWQKIRLSELNFVQHVIFIGLLERATVANVVFVFRDSTIIVIGLEFA